MTREEAINVIRGWVLADKDREALETVFPEIKENNDKRIREQIIYAVNQLHICDETKDKCIAWVKKQVPPKWLYRLEYKDGTCGLWYNGEGKWCFEQGIGSVEGCKTKDLPMDHDERYKQDGRDWFSSCSRKEDLMHWYSLEDAEKLIKKGFVFTRYLATEYHEYEQETVFIKESSLVREEIDIFELFGKTNQEFNAGDWVVNRRNGTVHQIECIVRNVSNNKNAYDLTDGEYIPTSNVGDYHLWTINDAMPEDVLVASDGSIFLCNGYDDHGVKYFVSLTKDGKLNISDGTHYWETARSCHPATKEEINLLFTKIKETGYEWDEKNMKLVNSTLKEKEEIDSGFTQMMENAGDKIKNFEAILGYIKDKGLQEWLKDQLRMNEVEEWSEEDKENYKEILTHLKVQGNSATLDVNRAKWRKLESWFKTRYPKFPKENSVDKEKIEKLIEACERAQDDFPQLSAEYTEIEELKEWLKYFNGDKWQPNMDQLDALQLAIESAEHEREYTKYDDLVSLMEDLKKL